MVDQDGVQPSPTRNVPAIFFHGYADRTIRTHAGIRDKVGIINGYLNREIAAYGNLAER